MLSAPSRPASLVGLAPLVCVAAIMVTVMAAPVEAQTLQEAWVRVQQGLTGAGSPDLDERIADLESAAADLQTRRLTPYSAAMVAWAHQHPNDSGELVLARAQNLDPLLPSAFFLSARWRWREGAYFDAVGSYLAGLWNLIRCDGSRAVLLRSALLCVLLALGLSIILVAVVQTVLHLRQLAHDAMELGLMVFGKANAIVFSVVILLLPLFAGFGPVWLLAYLYAMGLIYMRMPHRIFAILGMCVLACLPPALEAWKTRALRVDPVTVRVASMLDERRADFSALKEFADLESLLDGNPNYHLILGELFRLHGEVERGRLQFHKAVAARYAGPEAFVFLGSLSMEDAEVPRAIQNYNLALELDSQYALAYLDLSLAYDQSRRFQEGDDARGRARAIAGRETGELGLPGSDRRIRYPRLGTANVEEMVQSLSPELRLAVGADVPYISSLSSLKAPFSVAMLANCVLGVMVFVARRRWMWSSSSCSRCGKVFCPQCKSSTESMSYCSQCISVFLKRDMVSIDQQTSKLNQIRRWELLTTFSSKLTGLLVPGSHYVMSGKVILGFSICLASVLCLGSAVVWLPLFMRSAEPLASPLPLQLVFICFFAILWIQSAVASWYGR